MITFYRHTFASLTGGLWRVRHFAHEHPWWTRVIAVVVIDLLLVVFGNVYIAYAATVDPTAPYILDTTITDSNGVPLINYAMLPIDRGDVFNWGKAFIAAWLDPIWTGHLGLVSWMIWFCNWLVSFEWVSVVAAPFNILADLLQDFLGEIHWIPVALMIAGGSAGIAIMLGRHASGWAEVFISATCAVLAVGMLANPVATLTAAGGAFDTAQEYGGQIAAAVVSEDITSVEIADDDLLSSAVSSQLVDIFVRIPAQTIAFGKVLDGACASGFTDSMLTSSPVAGGGNAVRDSVNGCDPTAKAYNENPNFGQVMTAATIAPGALTVFIIPMAIGVLMLVTVFGFLIAALKTMWNVYLGILPINRYPLWRSLADTFTGLVSIVFMAVVMAAVLKLTVASITGLMDLGLPITAMMIFANLVMLVLIFLLLRARKGAKKAGRTMAEQLSKFGLNKGNEASDNDGMKAVATMSALSAVAAAAFRRPDRNVDARSIHFGPGAPGAPGATADIGTMTATRTPAAPSGPVGPTGGATGRPALPAPQRGPGGPPSGTAGGSKAERTADLVFTSARIAKGGAAGGVPGVIAAAGIEVGGRIAKKGASKAIESSTRANDGTPSKTATATQTALHVAPMVVAPQSARTPEARRIVVDSSGVGHVVRRSSEIQDISSLPARVQSPRNSELRTRLAIAQK
ncbi:hypothetical protein ACPW96_18365 [Micromonospora sp. DT81.3]|uniref:hypothetical protein n=1 Tax=Micromonospora sp. DT81.3 TaxID=3416523 RepID=UPI003CEB67EB